MVREIENNASPGFVPADSVEWAAQDVLIRLEHAKEAEKEKIKQVDRVRKQDETDTAIKLLVMLGVVTVAGVLYVVFNSMYRGFHEVLMPVLFIVGALALIWTGRDFLNALTIFLLRDRSGASKPKQKSYITIATYEQEKIHYEEEILKINARIREVEAVRNRARNRDSVSDSDYQRIQLLRFYRANACPGSISGISFWDVIRGWFRSARG